MFSESELQTTKTYLARKKQDLLTNQKGSDFDYIKQLQAIAKLENAVDEQENLSNGS